MGTNGGRKWCKLAREKSTNSGQVFNVGEQGKIGKMERDNIDGSGICDQKNKNVSLVFLLLDGEWRRLTRFSLAKLNEYFEPKLQGVEASFCSS